MTRLFNAISAGLICFLGIGVIIFLFSAAQIFLSGGKLYYAFLIWYSVKGGATVGAFAALIMLVNPSRKN
jgi:hypothetical protein